MVDQDRVDRLKARLERYTWRLFQVQMAELFETGPNTIGNHLKYIYREDGLEEVATTEEFSVVLQTEPGAKDLRPSVSGHVRIYSAIPSRASPVILSMQ